jgi:hypothetical protein
VKYNSSPKYFGVYTYSTNSITIYLKNHKGDLSEICSTVLHEIAHCLYFQKKDYKKKANELINNIKPTHYDKLKNELIKMRYVDDKKIIDDEIQARAFEKQYCQMCMIDLCKKGIISKC